jgi:hypothetical protein
MGLEGTLRPGRGVRGVLHYMSPSPVEYFGEGDSSWGEPKPPAGTKVVRL